MNKKIILLASCFLLLVSPVYSWEGDYVDSKGASIATVSSLESLFASVLTRTLSFVGLATFAMIIYGGFKYLSSGGDGKATESAKQTITYGILGLVLAIGSWTILTLLGQFTGIPNLIKFDIPDQIEAPNRGGERFGGDQD